MYKIWWTNHGYYAIQEFKTLDAARKYGEEKFFEHQIYLNGEMVGYWTTFGGWHENR